MSENTPAPGVAPTPATEPTSNLDRQWLESVRWDANGLVTAIAQEVGSQRILF